MIVSAIASISIFIMLWFAIYVPRSVPSYIFPFPVILIFWVSISTPAMNCMMTKFRQTKIIIMSIANESSLSRKKDRVVRNDFIPSVYPFIDCFFYSPIFKKFFPDSWGFFFKNTTCIFSNNLCLHVSGSWIAIEMNIIAPVF